MRDLLYCFSGCALIACGLGGTYIFPDALVWMGTEDIITW